MPATQRNALDWFEIPALDIERARQFYESLLSVSIRRETIAANELGVFEYSGEGAGGCLIAGPNVAAPSETGTMVYLHAGASLDAVLDRVEATGGRIRTPKTVLPGDMGCFAHIVDSEGNRVGLHAAA